MEDRNYNDAGVFRFYFWVENKWVPINVDDRLPARSWGSGYRPWATSMSVNGAMWMPLLEKAYAKFNQNYDRIAWGWGSEGLRTLSGMPTATLYHDGQSMSTMYSIHKHWASRNYPSVASCCNEVSGGIDGLVSGHAYSLLDVAELKDASGNVAHKIAKMRNPWSSEGYNGAFSDSSSLWTDAWK